MTSYNLSSFAGAGAQFFDDNGNPLTGGKVYTYAAGTTTPAATYTTSTGAVANTNPIILDAAGRTANETWLVAGSLYKFIVKTSADVLVGTYDGLPAINDPYSINSLLGSVTGTNAIAAVATPSLTAYAAGATYAFIAANSNTAAATLSIDGLAAKSITKNGSAALTAGDVQIGKLTWVQYDGTTFQLINNIVYGGSITNGNIVSLTTPLGAASGGTGLSTITANSVMLGNGISTVQTVAPGTIGNGLVSTGSIWAASPRGGIPPGLSSGLKIQATSNTAVTVTATQIAIGSTTGTYTPNTISLTLSTGTTGANALDTGTVAASTWYAVWAIYNETTVAGLLSLSATAPTMPSGYTHKGRIGWVRTDASSNLLRTIQYGTQAQYITPAAGFPVMATGSSAGVWLAVAVANFAPSTAGAIVVGAVKNNVLATIGAHPNNAIAVPTGTTSLSVLWLGDNGNLGTPGGIQGTIMLETTNIYWFSGTASANLYAQGWIDNV
jgi:hypothetical protein